MFYKDEIKTPASTPGERAAFSQNCEETQVLHKGDIPKGRGL